jgi:hypothetical protein
VPDDLPENDHFNDALGEIRKKAENKVAKAALGGWWSEADDGKKLAVGALVGAATLGPLGQGFLAAIAKLYTRELPSAEQIKAVFWLAVLTLPVFLAAVAGMFFLGKIYTPVVLGLAAAAAILGGVVMDKAAVPATLKDVYCYNDGRVLEHQCRQFNEAGFQRSTTAAGGGVNGWSRDLGYAFTYVADARGSLMAVSGVVGGLAAGYLVRREWAST